LVTRIKNASKLARPLSARDDVRLQGARAGQPAQLVDPVRAPDQHVQREDLPVPLVVVPGRRCAQRAQLRLLVRRDQLQPRAAPVCLQLPEGEAKFVNFQNVSLIKAAFVFKKHVKIGIFYPKNHRKSFLRCNFSEFLV